MKLADKDCASNSIIQTKNSRELKKIVHLFISIFLILSRDLHRDLLTDLRAVKYYCDVTFIHPSHTLLMQDGDYLFSNY